MRNLAPILAIALLAVVNTAAGGPIGAPAIAGIWRTASGGYIQIFRARHAFRGRVVGSASGKPRFDDHNPDAEQRGRRLLGVTLIADLAYRGDGEYGGGRIYDPRSGKTYRLQAKMRARDVLRVRGYVGIALFGKSQTWHRVSADAAHVERALLHRPIATGGDGA